MVTPGTGGDGRYEVVGPLGEPVVDGIAMAPRLDRLEGKRIGAIWNGGFRGDESFPMIEAILRRRYPGVTLIPYTEFPLMTIASLHPESKQKTLEDLRARIRKTGCDAVITGNGC
jgi:hypothetical protein